MKTQIKVKNLVKKYKGLTAVNDVSFDVHEGEIFGLLGENGAGKTTTMEIMEGLRKPTSGRVEILGKEIAKQSKSIKQKIGVQLQSSAYFSLLTLKEILELFGSFYETQKDPDELLKMVALSEKANSYVNKLSGGQKQRFSIVASLVNDPEIIFLDEPTTGLDPLARRNLWKLISQIKSLGKTIILTTHYMEEAETLCDRVAIMEKGKLLRIGKTHELVNEMPYPYKASIVLNEQNKDKINLFSKFGEVQEKQGKKNYFSIRIKSQKDLDDVMVLIQKIKPEDFKVSKASLEDLFILLTGKTILDD